MQGVERYKVRLLPHDERWRSEFEETKIRLRVLWKENVVDIQHFGSTSIQGVWAKPILDVAVVLKSFDELDAEAMTRAGYDDCGFQDPDHTRRLFVLRGDNEVSLHHIHCYEPDDADFKRCIGFRDYLNSHPKEAQEYSELKRKLAEKYPEDRFAYTDAKWGFVKSIYDALFLSDQAVSEK